MRFDLVDLQLFIAVATERSITAGALRAHLRETIQNLGYGYHWIASSLCASQ
jgi:hypothetical protein